MGKHRCWECKPHDSDGPFRHGSEGEGPELDSLETTFTDGGDEPFFTAGYSAREIAVKRAQEHGGAVYVNGVSRNIKRPDIGFVKYAVAKSPVYTLLAPDDLHPSVYRFYWKPL